ncbi:TolC family protein [Neotamlana laminarinivorans]|uniref:TolC family protein n=1 Tax=Neotamlana laminarinivorans TaxID=2883124 RepID=A0A9X1I2W7_9FLAO|nr:TolC family protein [Tamlana laminarinivorans]MCB4799342.1 TolC family protein [Tamlana laminarinivorans]
MKTKFFYISILLISNSILAQQLITPDKAVSLALENNYGIKVAQNSVALAENNADILNSGYLPELSFGADGYYYLNNSETEFSNPDTAPVTLNSAESSSYSASLDLSYTIFDGLGRLFDYKQLQRTKDLTELEAREIIENTILQLFTVYYSVAELEENTEAIKETLEISKERLVRAGYQFDYGQNTKLEVLNAEVDINNDSISVMNSRQELINFKRDLNLVLGNTIKEDFSVDTNITFNYLLDKNEMLEKAKQYNTSLLQIDKNIEINKYTLKSSVSPFLPSLGLVGSYGWNKNNNNAASFVSTSTSNGFTGGLSLTWDLFDGGSSITAVKNARINLDTQKIQKEELLVTIERDFNNSWDDYHNKLNIYKLQEANIKTSQNNFDRTQEKFKLGQVNSIEFRQAQINLLNAELTKNQAKYSAKLAELELLKISGEILNVKF